ncbi:hypothetical protein FRC03_003299 [Tulasnella sp. 419]|nr:hypothetical protein FRC03_003299 [Tulasnella sp. 419]
MLLLSNAALLQEDAVEEDTIEAEALGWLITQLGDIEKLHLTLACMPSIGNTPVRRRKLLDYTRGIIASLIHSLSVPPEQRGVLATNSGKGNRNREERPSGQYGMDQESRLMFYVTCLAELSQVIPWQINKSPSIFTFRAHSPVTRGWFTNNWHRIIIHPSKMSFTRELQFLHHWYPLGLSFFPSPLRHDLEALFTHHNSYIRTISQAALLQLSPWALPLEDISSWPVLRSTAKMEGDFFGRLRMLSELRMVTSRVIDMYHRYKTLNPSTLRYLYRYSDNALKLWIKEDVAPDERFLETVMVLGYLILENHTHIPRTTNSGDSFPMKVARCIMALKRWIDRNQEVKEEKPKMDSKLHDSFAHSIVAATLKYIQLAAKALESDRLLVKKEEGRQIDEDSVTTGMACLERSLRQLTTQEWPAKSLHNQVVSALETFHSINCDVTTNILPSDPNWDLAPLMEQLKSRIASSASTVEGKASAIRTACKLLNEVSDPSDASELAAHESPSLPELIGSSIQDQSTKWRIFTLSTVLDTSILSPATARSFKSDTSSHDEKPSSSSQDTDTRVDTLPYRADLVRLYAKI